MIDLTKTIIPKSDQLNADDLIGDKSITIRITKVSLAAGEQPIAINYDGDNGKPYMPCKSMRRLLVNCWGSDGNQYVGRLLTLYRDSKVKFGGLEVGGLRISHMSHIREPITMALTAAKSVRKPYTVHPISQPTVPSLDSIIADIEKAENLDGLKVKFQNALKYYPAEETKITNAKDKRKADLSGEKK